MTDLKFYTNPMSRGRIARWMLEEIGAPYETVFLRYGEEMNAPAYTSINPMAKVPAIKHGGRVVTECAAVCAYLADAFPQAGLAPAPADRHDYYRWMFFAAGPWEQASTNTSMGFEPNAEQSGMVGYGDYERTLAAFKRAVANGPYVCGESFTAADVYVGSQIGWGLGFGAIPSDPALEAYRDRIQGRPAYARASELDDAAMAEFGPTSPAG